MAKILVVDDELDFKFLINQKFKDEINANKFTFLFTYNGKQALSALRQNPDIDIVISDINMPKMNGISLIANIRKTNPDIKIIIASGFSNVDALSEYNIFSFLIKPFNLDKLKKTIDIAVKQKNLQL